MKWGREFYEGDIQEIRNRKTRTNWLHSGFGQRTGIENKIGGNISRSSI